MFNDLFTITERLGTRGWRILLEGSPSGSLSKGPVVRLWQGNQGALLSIARNGEGD